MQGKKLVTAHRRNITHIMEVDSKEIFKSLLPVGWVVRDYDCPDYGIDQVIEIFDAEEDGWVTSGEHLFIQIKSVSKAEYYEKKFESKDIKSIKTVKFVIDVKTLRTAEKMSSALPLILILVCLDIKSIFYVCLNDYIVNCAAKLSNIQESRTIYLPISNMLHADNVEKRLRFYSMRPKLYALFSAIEFQYNEIMYMTDGDWGRFFTESEKKKIKGFIADLKNNDIWNFDHAWGGIHIMYSILICAENLIAGNEVSSKFYDFKFMHEKMGEKSTIRFIWEQLSVFHHTYYSIIRVRELPTELESIFI